MLDRIKPVLGTVNVILIAQDLRRKSLTQGSSSATRIRVMFSSSAIGRSTRIIVPLPSFESTSITPPCSSTILNDMASPNPVPVSGCVKRIEDPVQVFTGNTGTGIMETRDGPP